MNKKPILCSVLLGMIPASGHSAILYTTGIPSPATPGDFDITQNGEVSSVHWEAVAGRSDYHAPALTTGEFRRAGVVNGNDGSGTLNDYLYLQNYNMAVSTMDFFAHTSTGSNFTAFTPQNFTSLNASWLVNRDAFATGGGYFLTIRTAGAWYASTTNAAGTPLSSETGPASLDLTASSWVAVNETPGVSLTLGSTVFSYSDLFSGGQQITGVGFYADDLSAGGSGTFRTLRLDNLVVEGVPEPTPALLALGALAFVPLLHRRR